MNDNTMNQHDEKLAYVAPELEVLGTLEDLTHGTTSGTVTDADFSAGTPIPDLTFS
ncbi:putative RiPP precursor [Salinarimonas rosea]|uniref:putative RiPP precursor n=1 Tax=Salinarimonas rosea TaxID=552063 RepID=UPI0004286371|nr:putative RiPP precursor [Salinarimonas rosea]